MYGHKKYNQARKVEQSAIDPTSVPTYLCGKCKAIKTINNPYVELSALENGNLFMYTKMCKPCADLLTVWLRR